MMKKFKIWHKSTNNFIEHKEISIINLHAKTLTVDVSDESGFGSSYAEDIPFEDVIFHEYTGFKDKNDVEVYEGHILLDDEGILFQVKWSDEGGCFGLVYYNNDPACEPLYAWELKALKVIGNIHENPELLEK